MQMVKKKVIINFIINRIINFVILSKYYIYIKKKKKRKKLEQTLIINDTNCNYTDEQFINNNCEFCCVE